MNEKEIFFQEKEKINTPLTHITDNINPLLHEIDELYGAADVLSINNAIKHQQMILILSIVGTVITFAFLLYDEAELHGLIMACIIFILFLFIIHKIANNNNYHKKYLKYRVLAETLRLQYFLSIAGITTQVADILPWFIRKSIPWIEEILRSLPNSIIPKKESVKDIWIKDQLAYHKSALKKAKKKKIIDEHITKIVIGITIISYVFALLFEIYVYRYSPNIDVHMIRAMLKIVLGTMSAITLFTGSYYGKMSLENLIEDHQRIIDLYEKVEKDIEEKGEENELLIFLAKEFLIENSTWYAYQSKNKVDIVI